jgi:hypothetical protein
VRLFLDLRDNLRLDFFDLRLDFFDLRLDVFDLRFLPPLISSLQLWFASIRLVNFWCSSLIALSSSVVRSFSDLFLYATFNAFNLLYISFISLQLIYEL